MNNNKMIRHSLLIGIYVLGVFGIVASGGGGGGGDDVGTAEGLWQGTISTDRALTALVLDDGTYWFIYSVAGNSAVLAGIGQGNGTSSDGSFTSSNGLDFNFEGLGENSFTLAANYEEMRSLNGTATYSPSDTTTFTSNYDIDYDITPSLTDIAGTYSGRAVTSAGIEFTTVKILRTGAINGDSAGGCTFTGNASTRANGNVYDVTITFGGGACLGGTGSISGQAYFDAATKQLTAAALTSTRTNGFVYIGTKP